MAPLRDELDRALKDPEAGDGGWTRCLNRVVTRRRRDLLPMLEWAAAQGHRNVLRLCIAELARALGPERLLVKASNNHTRMELRLRPRKNYWRPSSPKWSRQRALALLRSLDPALRGMEGMAQLVDAIAAASMDDNTDEDAWQAAAATVVWGRPGDHAATAAEQARGSDDEQEA